MSDTFTVDNQAQVPIVQQIQQELRRRIRSNDLSPGQKLPSMRQLSEQLDVSVGTVKQAVNMLTVEGYLRSSAGRGVYVCEPWQTKHNIALVLPDLHSENRSAIVRGVKRGLEEVSVRLLVQVADSDYKQEVDMIAALDPAFVCGAIIYPPPFAWYVEHLQNLRRSHFPFVIINHDMGLQNIPTIVGDSFMIGYDAMKHILDHGHRRVGFVDQSADSASPHEVREGMAKALQQVGMRFDDLKRVCVDATVLNFDEPWLMGEKASEQLLKQHPDLTAVIGGNGYITTGLLRAAHALGRGIGKDLSVLSLSDLFMFKASVEPIDALNAPYEQMGFLAAKALSETLAGDQTDAITRLAVPLNVRGSVTQCTGGA
ncbi:MAG: LacI family DNA-binding transcriptional regulator [Phycisphaeraceae bacterium JB051]